MLSASTSCKVSEPVLPILYPLISAGVVSECEKKEVHGWNPFDRVKPWQETLETCFFL
jgi:hypothetical protein